MWTEYWKHPSIMFSERIKFSGFKLWDITMNQFQLKYFIHNVWNFTFQSYYFPLNSEFLIDFPIYTLQLPDLIESYKCHVILSVFEKGPFWPETISCNGRISSTIYLVNYLHFSPRNNLHFAFFLFTVN